jgi:hypothetical protein|tara:strand:+ start:4352 stop:4615 length:264 start_codon:yes stop_codon:yes gene_type:complete
MNNQNERIKFFVITYTSWTHQSFLQDFTADSDASGPIEFAQQVIRNDEIYGQIHVRASVDYYNKLKELLNSNTNLSFNLEYAPISAK